MLLASPARDDPPLCLRRSGRTPPWAVAEPADLRFRSAEGAALLIDLDLDRSSLVGRGDEAERVLLALIAV